MDIRPFHNLEEHEALKLILEGTSREIGEGFFRALVQNLAAALGTQGAWVTQLDATGSRLKAFAFWLGGEWIEDYEYDVVGTPCEEVVKECRAVHVPENIIDLYPNDLDLPTFKAVSYLGVPLIDADERVIGHLAVVDDRPMPQEPCALAIIQIFAARAAAEVARLWAERVVAAKEEQLSGLLNSALDAIVQLDSKLELVRANPAAEKTFGATRQELEGQPFVAFLSEESTSKFRRYVQAVETAPNDKSSLWIAGGLEARRADGSAFPAEASLARFDVGSERFIMLILRDVDERRQAELQIETLRQQAEQLQEQLEAIEGSTELLGRAPSFRAMLREIVEVADTDATVLIQGETGTGKELVARAIHATSRRQKRAWVKVNCGAISPSLVESELFGHEKGAFTGATARRDGRFLMADEGTLFLDEIGELSLDLQVKLLRVLQEGEFEPVGSSRTLQVDVRIIAATHRNLAEDIVAGRFREDLFYRLNVFPIHVPPLRDRKEDIPMLAEAFAHSIAKKIGRSITEISPDDYQRLQSSDWPGNVRELRNVIERAVITARGGRLNIDRALPQAPPREAPIAPAGPTSAGQVKTPGEMQQLERDNLLSALTQTGWKISGPNGAAALLGLSPSTLTYRMKALGISRPS